MRIAVVMMQRDEGDLLRYWVAYHSKLLGQDNIFIIDNESTDPATLDILDQAGKASVSVLFCAAPEFKNKGAVVSALIESHQEIDWFFPLDCDEFIGASRNGTFVASRDLLFDEVAAADRERKTFCRVKESWWNVPLSTGAYGRPCWKVGVKPAERAKLDTGFHMFTQARGDLLDPAKTHLTAISYAHFHNRPFGQVIERARLKLQYRVKDQSLDTIKAYRGAGEHLVKYFSMTEQDYLRSLQQPTIDLAAAFATVGVEVPFSTPAAASATPRPLPPMPSKQEVQDLETAKSRPPPLKVAMNGPEKEFFLGQLKGKRSYLEYGCGGSTKLALDAGIRRVVSIDSDLAWIRKLREHPEISAAEKDGRLRMRHAKIGKTGAWGKPKDDKEIQRWPDYHSGVWARDDSDFDVVLIDGRFRVACALACAVFASPKATIIMHDYALRPKYYVIEKYFDTIAAEGTMVALKRRATLNMRAWALDMLTYALDPD